MDQVDGRIPLDNPPYVFTGWLLEATPEEIGFAEHPSISPAGYCLQGTGW